MTQFNKPVSRRHFIYTSTIMAGAAGVMPASGAGRTGRRKISPNEKLNIGLIGAGGKGGENLAGVESENIVALCDVDEKRAAPAFQKHPNAKRYVDWRVMLEKQKDLDAVMVTTPDHMHAHAGVAAMRQGLHVYCEKPLTRAVSEARLMRDTARKYKVATQMGNQGHSYNSTREVVEIVRSGAIGKVTQVHVWTDRPIWPQGLERPQDKPAAPETLNWDLWLGPAPERPYHSAYVPFNWRGWWDFGTGALGDMACHNWDTAYWALNLGLPTSVEAESEGGNAETAPKWSIIKYQFPARGRQPAVLLTWYDGGKKPSSDLIGGAEFPKNGTLMIGDRGMIFMLDWNADRYLLLPKEKFVDFKPPAPTIPRSPGHYQEWITACKGGPAALSNFDYAATLSEAVLLGNVALRTGKKIEWDARKMRARKCPEADPFIKPTYRKGWELT